MRRTTLWLVPRRVAPVAQPGLRPVPGPQLHQRVPPTDQVPRPHVGPHMAQLLLSRSMNLLDVVEDLLQRRVVGHRLEDRCHAQIRGRTRSTPPSDRLAPPAPHGSPHPPVCRSPGTSCTSSPPAGRRAHLWPQLFSDVSCIALWISSEKILTRLYSVLHWFHKRLEANVKKPRENRCFQTVIVFSFSSFDNSNKYTVLLKIAARLITVSTSVNKEMWVKLRP